MLKIEGFEGKFQVAGGAVRKEEQPTAPSVKAPLREEANKPSSSFKLKEAFASSAQIGKEKKNTVAEQRVTLEARDSFDVEKIERAYDDYIRAHNPERTVIIALKAHKPLIRGEEICIEVDNQLQRESLESERMKLQNALVKSLNNGSISLSLAFFDNKNSKEEKKLITVQDKFEHFVRLNPVFGEMCEVFSLQIE